ncbi:MAG: hypothetical protein AB2L24_22760 [Mangrovibacterium sp.]
MRNNLTMYIDLLKNVFSGNNVADRGMTEQIIQQETEKISNSLARMFYWIDNENKQRAFVRNLHARLVRLSDHFYGTARKNNTEPPPESSGPDDGQRLILSTLQDLIDSVYRDYSALYDKNQKITDNARPVVTSEIKEKLESLSLPVADPEHSLFEEVKASVDQCFEEAVITYGLVSYLHAFIREIILVKEHNLKQLIGVTLTDLLISFNFNSVSVVSRFISNIREEASKIEKETDKITFFNHWLKRVSQLPVSSADAFDSRRESAFDCLHKWLSEEILFHEKSLMLHSGVPYGTGLSVTGNGVKLELNLSVQQIACFMRLFIQCGIIKNGGTRDLSAFISEHFRSRKQENISVESLRVKYYNIEESTRMEVRQTILDMLKQSSSPM